MLRARACGLSDVGVLRSHNEDCFEIDPVNQMFVVADGMGGHSHGEIASRIAVQAIRECIATAGDGSDDSPGAGPVGVGRQGDRIRKAIRFAHDRVLKAIRQDGSLHGMGTTVVGMVLENDTMAVAHVGDSRAYRLRNGRFELLTQDHTWVNEQVIAGFLTEEQARVHPLKNVVTRALGGDSEVQVDVTEWPVEVGDLFLLCSDGLTSLMNESDVKTALASNAPGEACAALVDLANENGGKDNITIQIVKVHEK